MSPGSETGAGETGLDLLAGLRDDPGRSALLTDIDGTLAPIVERPEQAAVPSRATDALEALSARFHLVGCVSGRQALEARRLVGSPRLAYAGNHGLELLLPEEEEPRLDPSAQAHRDSAARFLDELGEEALATAGLRREDKGPIQALHWRGAGDEQAAEARARETAAAAEGAGLRPHWGRKVLELRPPGGGGKEAAVSALLGEAGLAAAAYAGDDRTDLDAFRRLRELQAEGALSHAICIGIASAEGPAELAEEADFCVEGPAGWLALLESLAS